MPATYTKSATLAAQSSQQEQNNNNERHRSSSCSGGGGTGAATSGGRSESSKLSAATSGRQQSFEEKRSDSIQSGEGQDSLNSCTNSDENRSLNNSNAEYDRIRNTTLMFFLDRLFIASKEGKGPRTLHDLSCLFGKREFTKEMRQIVGASRNGLKKFLQSYPSLFTIDGDKVYLTQLQQDPTNPAVRDYNREAIEYFTKKLQQFGTSLVPIRNLFGYRSQASQEVRHVSGKSIKEFKEFLAANSDVFEMLADEHVVLKSVIEEFESRGEYYSLVQMQQTLPGEEVVMDPYLNKQFAHYIEELMKKMDPKDHPSASNNKQSSSPQTIEKNISQDQKEHEMNVRLTIEFLHEKILQDCNNQLFLKMVETIDEFRVFLRMHPKIFKRFKIDSDSCEYVSLLSDEERKEFETQTNLGSQQASISRQQSTLRRSDTYESNLSGHSSINSSSANQQATSLPPTAAAGNFGGQQQLYQQVSDQPMSMIDPALVAKSSSSRKALATKASLNNNSFMNEDDLAAESRKPATLSRQPTTSSNNSLNTDQSSSLRAAAPPFVPKQLPEPQNTAAKPSSASQTQLNQSSKQPSAAANQTSSTQQQAQAAGRGIIDPRQAIRSYLTKASVSNTANGGIYAPNKQSNGGSGGGSRGFLSNQQQQKQPKSAIINQKPLSRQSSSANVDDLRARTVSIVREASNIITKIINTTDAVAFDCKGYNLGFNGQISLILFGFIPNSLPANSSGGGAGAILAETHSKMAGLNGGDPHNNNNSINQSANNKTGASQKPEVCIFDLITNPELAYCLKPLLESDKVVKVVHDVRNKSNALFVQFDIVLNNVFDTQVANLVIQQQETGKPAYMSRYISMGKLCEVYGDEALEKYRNLIRSKTRHSTTANNSSGQLLMKSSSANSSQPKFKDVNYWRTRPLTEAMVYESTMDVYSLLSGVYQSLKSKIKPEYQPLCKQLNDEGVLARIKPDEIRSIKKERKIDLEVIDLKRKLYSDSTGFIVLSNREIRLLRHIEMTDEVRKKIQQCKKVAKKLERLDMKQAQQNQLLNQSMSSQLSGASSDGTGDQQSLDPNSRTNIGSSDNEGGGSSTSSNNSSINNHHRTQDTSEQQNKSNSSELAATSGDQQIMAADDDACGMSNLMDSSMFDELKDKMIESSSLLESLEDDDDDDEHNSHHHHHLNNASHSHHQHGNSSDSCRCKCHHKTTSSSSSTTTTADMGTATDNNEIQDSSKNELTKQLEQASEDKNPDSSLKSSASSASTEAKSDKDEHSSVESRVADMAVQCDLLS